MQEHLRVGREVFVRFRRGGIEVDDNVLAGLNELETSGLIGNKVWVTPGLPFMIPITAGFYVAVVYGDLIFLITRYMVGF
jgi:preflagellin peptidase FlaK